MYRQGDVLLAPVERVPKRARSVVRDDGRLVLAVGEATGHAHLVEGDSALVSDPADGERFLRVRRESRLVHDEHEALVLVAGDYRVVRQREYTGRDWEEVME
jgi:hypothetical protein